MEVTVTLTATYEALLDLLCDLEIGETPRRIAIHLHDGSVVEGEAHYALDMARENDSITLLDERPLPEPNLLHSCLIGTFNLADIKHIKILEDN